VDTWNADVYITSYSNLIEYIITNIFIYYLL